MKFDIEADASGFNSAMQSVQDSVMTTYERIEKQNAELDKALAEGMKDVTDAIKNTGDEMKELEKRNAELEKTMESVDAAMKDLYDVGDTQNAALLEKELDDMAKEFYENSKAIEASNKKLEEYRDKQSKLEETTRKVANARKRDKETLVDLLGGQEKYNTIISALPPALQSSQGGIMNMVKAAKAFIATPFGLAIAAIAAALKALMSYFTGTVEGERQFAQVSGYLSGVMAKLNDVLIDLGRKIVKVFTDPKAAMEKFKDAFVENITNRFNAFVKSLGLAGDIVKDLFSGDWSKLKSDIAAYGDAILTVGTGIDNVASKFANFASEVHGAASEMANLAAREKDLELEKSNWAVERAKLEAKRNQIMEKMYEGTYEEQLESAKQAVDINNKIAAQDKKLAKEAYDIIHLRNSLASSNTADLTSENTAHAEMARVDAEASAANRRLARQMESLHKNIRNAELSLNEQQQDSLLKLTRMMQDNELEAAQQVINAMNDGAMKEMKQRELNHKKQVIQIERQQEDSVKAARDAAKAAWKADAKHSNETFDDSILSSTGAEYDNLSQNDKLVVDNYVKAVNEARKRAANDLQAEDVSFLNVNDLLKEYQDYDAKRLAIDEKYAVDRERLNKALVNATKEGNSAMIESIKASMRQLDMSEAKEKMQNALDKLKADPAFIDAFQDLKKVSTDTLKSLLDQLEKNKEALVNLDPEQLKVITDLMTGMEDEIMNRAGAMEAYKIALTGLKKAEDEKARADKAAAQAQMEYDDAVELSGKDSEAALNALNRMTAAKKAQNKASNDLVKAQAKEAKEFDKLIGASKELMSAFQKVGDAIGGDAKEIADFIGNIFDFTTTSIDAVKKMSEATADALGTIEKASAILTIISMAIQLFQKLTEITNKFSDMGVYNKEVEKQREINDLADAVNNYTLSVLKAQNAEANWFGNDQMRTLKTNSKEMSKVYEDYYKKLYQDQVEYRNKSRNDDNWTVTLQKWSSWLTGGGDVLGYGSGKMGPVMAYDNIGKSDYQAQMKKAYENLRIETKKRKKSFLGMGGHDQKTADLREWAKEKFGEDLFDPAGWINVTMAQQILDSYGGKLQGETKETIERLVDLKNQYDEYMNQLKEYVSQLYQPLVENFTDSILDWLDTGKDALDSFQEYASDVFRNIVKDMLNTIVLEKVVGTFQQDILDMYEKYGRDNNYTETDLMRDVANRTSEMVNTYEQQMPVLQEIAGNMQRILEDTTGIDITKGSANTTATTLASSFTQDSVDELNGRMTALQIGQQSQITALANISVSLLDMTNMVVNAGSAVSDIRDLDALRNSYILDIYERLGQMSVMISSRLTSIDTNTKRL